MPIVFKHSDSLRDLRLAVWDHATDADGVEPSLFLDESELAQFNDFRSQTRKAEFLTVRRLLREMGVPDAKIAYDPNGRPGLSDGGFVSITHSGTKVAVIVSYTRTVGIDLETIRPHISSIAAKFISEAEYRHFENQLDDHALHIIWCAKEILFKLYSKGNVDFRRDLSVERLASGEKGAATASIDKPDFKATVTVEYFLLDGCMLAWAAH